MLSTARIGELLLGQGLIAPPQLERALKAQVTHGARLGTNMVELGFVAIDRLAVALGVQHGVPAANPLAFERVTSAVLGVMPRDLCAAFRVFPLAIDGRNLHLAMCDPQDLKQLDQIGRTLGMTIHAYAAPELRILYFLERCYRIARPKRFLRAPGSVAPDERRGYLQATVESAEPPAAPKPASGPPRGGLISATDATALAVTPPGALRPAAGARVRRASDPQAAPAPVVRQPPPVPPQPAPAAANARAAAAASDEQVALRVERSIAALGRAGSREEVIRALTGQLCVEAELVVVFLVREEFAVALDAWGTNLRQDQIKSLVVPINQPSLLKTALAASELQRHDATGDWLQQMVAQYLRRPAPRAALVAAVRPNGVAANLLCIQSQRPIADPSVQQVRRLVRAAEQAYERLVEAERRAAAAELTGTTTATRPALWHGPDSWTGSARAKALGGPKPAQNLFGRYEMICRFASGGMANLYLARLAGLDGFEKLVAIKCIHEHLSEDVDFIARFGDEARLAARISHPNVVNVIEYGTVGRSHYIAMEYVDGESLAALLNRTDLTPTVAARVISEAAAGLHAAHELRGDDGQPLNVVHRDVSPHNLLVSYEGAVKVVDFGVATARNNLHVSFVGTIAGKVAYMAPEQARGDKVDRRCDVFALGIILYEMTTNQRLFKGPTEAATLANVISAKVPPPSSVIGGYPAALEAIVLRALQADPGRRFATAQQMQEALEDYIVSTGSPVHVRTVAQLMTGVFADRIKQKRQLLQQTS